MVDPRISRSMEMNCSLLIFKVCFYGLCMEKERNSHYFKNKMKVKQAFGNSLIFYKLSKLNLSIVEIIHENILLKTMACAVYKVVIFVANMIRYQRKPVQFQVICKHKGVYLDDI
jgi:hypothetical protein